MLSSDGHPSTSQEGCTMAYFARSQDRNLMGAVVPALVLRESESLCTYTGAQLLPSWRSIG